MEDGVRGIPGSQPPRIVADRILQAFDQAADIGRADIAKRLLVAAELALETASSDLPAAAIKLLRDRLVLAHERLWTLLTQPACDED